MKSKIPFITLLAIGAFTVTSCNGGNFRKVTYATYNYNGSTIANINTSTRTTRTLIGAYKFDSSSSYGSQIKDFYSTWYLTFSYEYDLITKKNVTDIVLPTEIVVNLYTSYTQIATAKMLLNYDCGTYESYQEAFINESTLEGKQISHTFDTLVKGTGQHQIARGEKIYKPYKGTTSGLDYYYLDFRRSSDSDLFTIQHTENQFIQHTYESYVRIGQKAENVVVTYTLWSY